MRLPACLLLAILATPGVAQTAPQLGPAFAPPGPAGPAAPEEQGAVIADLIAALQLDGVIAAMRSEGIDYGESLEADLFPGRGGAGWRRAVDAIYGLDAMRTRLIPALERELARMPPAMLAEARGFFRSDLGQRIVALENSARLAQLDEDIKAESQRAAEALAVDDPERFALLRRFIAANDLVEANVVGALNANAAFYFGLNAAGAFADPLSEAEVLSDVAAQEEGIRAETADWIDAYLALAYQPLSDADLRRYLAFSETPAGQALNRAMFVAYDAMFTAISRELGSRAARHIAGEDL